MGMPHNGQSPAQRHGGNGQALAAPPQQLGPQIGPSPLPTHVSVGQALTGKGDVLAACMFVTPQGTNTFFLEPHMCKTVGEALLKIGRAGESGLIVGDQVVDG